MPKPGAQDGRLTLKYLDGLSVDKQYQQAKSDALRASLLQERKLALILDLDHTLLHSTMRIAITNTVRLVNL